MQGVLSDPSVLARLADTRAGREMQALQSFFAALASDAELALYSYRHVRVAVDRGAVATVLVCDALLRYECVTERGRERDIYMGKICSLMMHCF